MNTVFSLILAAAAVAVAGYILASRRPAAPDPVRDHADRGIRELEGYLQQQAPA